MLRSISLDIIQRVSSESVADTVTINDAPALRVARVCTLPDVKVDMPWSQMTILTLRSHMPLPECISVLRRCPNLVTLTVSTSEPAATPTDLLTLSSLETLTCNFGLASILEHLTLPRLSRLDVSSVAEARHATVLSSFLRRSACPLRFLAVSVAHDITPDTLILCFRAVDESVSDLELSWPVGRFPVHLFSTLHPADILPGLKILRLRGGQLSDEDYQGLVDMLHVRVLPHTDGVPLQSLTLHLTTYSSSSHTRRPMPRSSQIAQLQELEAAGLKINFTILQRMSSRYRTHVLLDSCAASSA